MGKVKTVIFTIIAVVLSSIGLISSYASPAVYAEETKQSLFENQNVLEDLKGSTIEGEAFDLTKYNFDDGKAMKLMTLAEFCYSFKEEKQKDYGLYAYVYNPQGKAFNFDSEKNEITIRAGGEASASFTQYRLKFLNQSTQAGYEGLFIKFRVELSESQKQDVLKKLTSGGRVYEVGEVQLMKTDKDFEVASGAKYTYTGYAEGYGSETAEGDTLSCKVDGGLLTLSLDVHSTAYRPEGSNGKDEFTQDSLHSVYFSVPNEMIAEYGDMVQIHAKWLNATLKPGLVTGNREIYEKLLPIAAHNIPFADIEKYKQQGIDFPYMYLGNSQYKPNGSITGGAGTVEVNGYFVLGNYHDMIEPLIRYKEKELKTLPVLLYASNGNADKSEFASTEELLNYIKSYPNVCPDELDPLKADKSRATNAANVQAFKSAVAAIPSDGLLIDRFNAIQAAIKAYHKLTEEERLTVQTEIEALNKAIADYNELVNGLNQDHENSVPFPPALVAGKYPRSLFSKWDTEYTEKWVKSTEEIKLKDFKVDKKWWQHIFGGVTMTETDFGKLQAIQSVSDADLKGTDAEISKRLAVGKADLPNFKAYYDEAKKADKTVFLFRFYQSEYKAQTATLARTRQNWAGFWKYEEIDSNAYFFQTDVNLNFDIIDITYQKGVTYTTIPVVFKPIDIVPNPTPPIITTPDFKDFWKYGLSIMGGLALIGILAKIIEKGAR